MGTNEISTAAVTSTVMLVISILFALILAVAALVGFFRRWKRSTVSLCRIILAVILAALIVFIIGISTNFSGNISNFVTTEFQSESEELSETALLIIVATLYSILIPFFFVIVFIIVAQLLRIPAYFISKALHITKQDELERQKAASNANIADAVPPPSNIDGKKLLERFGGALITAVSALIVICVCILPVTGIFCTVADGLDELSKEAAESNETIKLDSNEEIVVDGQIVVSKEGVLDPVALSTVMNTTVAPIRNNFFVSLSYSAPMKLIYRNITKVEINDVTVSFGEEAENLFRLASNVVCFAADFENYGERQMRASDEVANYVINSEFHCELAAELISSIAKSIDKPSDNEFLDSMIETLKSTTKESVAEDVSTFRDIFKSAVKNKIPKSIARASAEEDGYLDVLENTNEEFVYDVLFAIQKNNHFGGLATPALNYAFETVSKSLKAENNKIQAGTDLKDLSEEQLKAEAKNIASALSDIKNVALSFKNIDGKTDDNMSTLMNLDLAPLGRFIDSCENSLLLGNGAREVLVSIMRSEAFSENGLDEVFGVLADRIENGEDLSMERILVAMKEIVKVIGDYQEGKETIEELTESLKAIVQALDAETASAINEMMPKISARMIDGGDSVNEVITQKMLTSFVESLSSEEAKELADDDEKFAKEVLAIDMILDMINSATAGKVYSVEDIKEVVETIVTSKIVTNALVSAAYDENGNLTNEIQLLKDSVSEEDKQAVVNACKEYYDENKSSYSEEELETVKSNLKAIASIFGENITAQVKNWD